MVKIPVNVAYLAVWTDSQIPNRKSPDLAFQMNEICIGRAVSKLGLFGKQNLLLRL